MSVALAALAGLGDALGARGPPQDDAPGEGHGAACAETAQEAQAAARSPKKTFINELISENSFQFFSRSVLYYTIIHIYIIIIYIYIRLYTEYNIVTYMYIDNMRYLVYIVF